MNICTSYCLVSNIKSISMHIKYKKIYYQQIKIIIINIMSKIVIIKVNNLMYIYKEKVNVSNKYIKRVICDCLVKV